MLIPPYLSCVGNQFSPAMVTIIPSSSYIIPSSSSFHPPPSLALFLWFNNNRSSHKKIGRIRRQYHHHHERRLPFSLTSLSAATTPSLPSQPGGGGKGELYNDGELLELLLLHQSISTTNYFTADNDARVDVDADITISGETEEGSPTTDSLGGIHDWVLQALENDIGIYNDDYGTNNNNDNSDFDHINGSDNTIIDDETVEGPPLMSTVVHDWILQAIENDSPMITSFDAVVDDNDEEKGEDDSSSSMKNAANRVGVVVATNNDDNNHLQMLLQKRKPYIRAIATDVDGTLLNGICMHPITRDAILYSIRQSSYSNDCGGGGESKRYFFFVATGKSRAGAMTSLGPEIGSLISSIPGVYCQGLYCVDNRGKVIFERKLQHSAIQATEALAIEYGISIVAYDGDNLYTTNCTDSVIGLSEVYGEPSVQLLFDEQTSGGGGGGGGGASSTIPISLADYRPGFHKILLLDDDLVKLGHVRAKLEILASLHNATVTQAIPTMLELLPVGCSKAYGVEQVCLSLGINPRTELLAIGDAENDVGMLQMASIGIAVGNASPQARDAADFIMKERNDEGGAGLAMNLFGF